MKRRCRFAIFASILGTERTTIAGLSMQNSMIRKIVNKKSLSDGEQKVLIENADILWPVKPIFSRRFYK